MNIRNGEISEIENFPLFSEENDGNEIIVVEQDGEIVGYAQYNSGRSDAEIFFMESNAKGCGRAIIDWFKAEFEEVTAVNAVETARPFYAHMGFENNGGTGYVGQINMTWWAE